MWFVGSSLPGVIQSLDIIVRHLVTSPFKSVCFQIFCKNYCRKTTKKVPNESKLIYTINIFIVASCYILFSYGSHYKLKCHFFNDVYVSINGNCDILKFTSTLNAFYLRTINIIIVIFYFILLFSFHPCKFCRIAPINFVIVFFTKNLKMHWFKRPRHKVGTIMSDVCSLKVNLRSSCIFWIDVNNLCAERKINPYMTTVNTYLASFLFSAIGGKNPNRQNMRAWIREYSVSVFWYQVYQARAWRMLNESQGKPRDST